MSGASHPGEDFDDAVVIVLAGGSGRRFGGQKLLSEFEGRPLIQHVLDVASATRIPNGIVVVPTGDTSLRLAIEAASGMTVVANPNHRSGQASSLRAGLVASMESMPTVVLAAILLADQPRISAEVVRAVVGTARHQRRIARTRYDDGPGHPVVLPRYLWPYLLAELTGDVGMRPLFERFPVVEVRRPGPMPMDVDRPEDLARLR